MVGGIPSEKQGWREDGLGCFWEWRKLGNGITFEMQIKKTLNKKEKREKKKSKKEKKRVLLCTIRIRGKYFPVLSLLRRELNLKPTQIVRYQRNFI